MADFTSNTQIHRRSIVEAVVLAVMLFCFLPSMGQKTLSTQNKKATKLYEKGQQKARERDFESAIELFSQAVKYDDQFYEAYLRKGSLYNAMGMEDSVYANLTNYLQLVNEPVLSVLERMIQMAFNRGKYNIAEGYLKKLIAKKPEIVEDRKVGLLKESLSYAKSELSKDSLLDIKELPTQVNKYTLQYLPTMTIDESQLIYTKRDRLEGDEDIVVSHNEGGVWQESVSISSKINTPLNEGASTISADGRTLIFTSCDKRDSYGSCDLYVSRKVGASWSKPKNIGKPISSRYWESQPSLSADGKTLYFSSNRPGGFGARDLWVSIYKDGKWLNPKNLGAAINTFNDETTPFIHPDGETLYFSSNGHVGMGGFDLLKSERADSIWSVKNLGYPINTFNDEVALLISANGTTAYFAKEVQKNHQITDSKIVTFKLTYDQRAKSTSYVIGKVIDKLTSEPLKADVEVYDLELGNLIYQSSSDSISGQYVMVLPSGNELGCFVKKKGYLFSEYTFISEPNTLVAPDTIEIQLKPIAINESLVLENIYFDIDSYQLNEKSLVEIGSVTEVLEDNPMIKVEISGHTDNSGNASYNQSLSENRAQAVYKELIKKGIKKERLAYKGYGDRMPISDNDSEPGRESNRRIEFRVIAIDEK